MRIKIAIIVGVALSAPAAAEVKLQISPTTSQQSRYEDGRRMTDSVTTAATVRFVQPKVSLSKRGGFMLVAFNSSGSSFDLGPENVTARLADGTPVPIVGYDRLIKEAANKQWWQNFAMALTAPSVPSGDTTGTVAYRGSTYGSVGVAPYSGTTAGTVTYAEHDPLKAAAAGAIVNEENRRRMEALHQRQQAALQAIETEVLQTTTVDPGMAVGGMLYFDIPAKIRRTKAPVPVSFTVVAGGEAHVFQGTFDPSR